ncbi:MAG: sulfatase [bacterium]|nr:sulfatase [bacterium]
MNRRDFIKTSVLGSAYFAASQYLNCGLKNSKPNIVILFADDAGYADFSLNSNMLINTPNIDSIAQNGVKFTDGYMSGAVCSPSRAGLLTGRYQQRFGHEFNLGENYSQTDPDLMGLPVEEFTIAELLKKEGYATGIVGKWHLGKEFHFHPCNRGFDEFFGMLEGSSTYRKGEARRMKRNFEQAEYTELPYLTDAFGDEACSFIDRHKAEPFFLYLSFNAVHTPMHARPDILSSTRDDFETEERAINAAMTRSLDDNVGKVLNKLRELGIIDNTIVIFTNDNGGALPYNASCNDPLAGTKGTFLEGGVRVPFIMQYPDAIAPGTVYSEPVISLDILPTALAAAGGVLPSDREYDGVNLIPYFNNETGNTPHETLFWRLWHHGAVRKGDWKLIWFDDKPPRLHNLAEDIGEKNDLSADYPDKTEELLSDFNNWQEKMTDPLWRTDPVWKKHSRDRYDQEYVDTLKRQ